MTHEVETMAYAGETPWHGLGRKVDPDTSIDEMLVAAGLDWDVSLEPCFAKVGDEYVSIKRKALIRSSDKKMLTVTGDQWKPLQNRDALEFFRSYTDAGGARLETAGSLRGGRVIWGLAALNMGFSLNKHDKSKGYVLLVSPHEVGRAITVRTTSVRVVCANTMQASMSDTASFSQNHLTDFNVDAARAAIGEAREQIIAMGKEAKVLEKIKLDALQSAQLFAKFFQPAEEELEEKEEAERVAALLDQPQTMNKNMVALMAALTDAPGATPGNAWGTLNAMTYFIDHVAGREKNTRLFRSWLGDYGRTKIAFKDELLELAE